MMVTVIYVFVPARYTYETWETFNGTPTNTSLQILRGDFSGGWIARWRTPFTSSSSYENYAQFAIADVDGDGENEIVGSYNDNVVAFDGATGTIEWTFVRSRTGWLPASAVGDVNGDAAMEVVTDDDRLGVNQIVALRGTDGTVLWRTDVDALMYSSPKIGDVDGDGVPEVVVGTDAGTVYVLNGNDGSIDCTFSTGGSVRSTAALDSNRIVIGSLDNRVYALDGSCNLVWQYTTGGGVWSSPVLVDVNGDAVRDVVIGSGDGYVYALNGGSGSLIWRYDLGCYIRSAPVVADVDQDMSLDVIAGGTCGNVVSLRASDGILNWSTTLPYRVYPYGAIGLADLLPSSPGIEIVVVTEPATWSSNHTYLLSSSGSVIVDFAGYGDGFALGDADNDGCTELILECDGCSDGKDILYDSPTNDGYCGAIGTENDLSVSDLPRSGNRIPTGEAYDVSGRKVRRENAKGVLFIRTENGWRKVVNVNR